MLRLQNGKQVLFGRFQIRIAPIVKIGQRPGHGIGGANAHALQRGAAGQAEIGRGEAGRATANQLEVDGVAGGGSGKPASRQAVRSL
jgi:hypothetical protein